MIFTFYLRSQLVQVRSYVAAYATEAVPMRRVWAQVPRQGSTVVRHAGNSVYSYPMQNIGEKCKPQQARWCICLRMSTVSSAYRWRICLRMSTVSSTYIACTTCLASWWYATRRAIHFCLREREQSDHFNLRA